MRQFTLQPPDTEEKGSARSTGMQKSHGRPGQWYEPVSKLGEGAFGIAHLVRDKRASILRVLKTINKRQAQVPYGQLEKEIRNLKACDHPHIVRLFEYYEDYENIYLIMEHAEGGELHHVLEQQKQKGMNLPERWVSNVMKQCLLAIAYVHLQGIIHKDLKSENILLLRTTDPNDPQSQPHAVIIDLGIGELFSARLGRRARCTVVAGTPTHMAPEVWRGNFGPVADVWSLGVVTFELLAGEIPFFCSHLNSAQEWLRMHRQGPNWSLLGHTSSQAQAICKRMLNWDERMRPTAQQCLGHSWFKDQASPDASAPETTDQEEPADDVGCVSQPLTARSGQASETVVQAVGDYMGRSKFEKAVLLQVSSQLHISQMARVHEVFTSADSDQSGTLPQEELINALGQLGVQRMDAEVYAECVEVDGRIDYTELASGCIGLLYSELRGLLWQSFCTLDVEGDGNLGKDDVQAVVTRPELVQYGFPGGEPPATVDQAISTLVLDSNGQVSFEELCRVFLPRPTFGQRQQDAEERPRRSVMRDEEFAQLLDEIEAGQSQEPPAPSAAAARSDEAGDGRRHGTNDSLGLGDSFAAAVAASAVEASPVEAARPVSKGAPVKDTTCSPAADGNLDEELSTLLADIAANGP
mmetsp:Transcript_63489/g.182701  ORF Transcript_63489/g.182701 Transcript_63489/m.182701 type:complete len:640 (+) Transcript_63489:162-2081(+)